MVPTSVTSRYCRACGYDLRASEGRCPECGRPFDPADPRSFAAFPHTHVIRWWVRRLIVAMVPLILLAAGYAWLDWRHRSEQACIKALQAIGVELNCTPSYPWLHNCLPERFRPLLVHARSAHAYLGQGNKGRIFDDEIFAGLEGLPELEGVSMNACGRAEARINVRMVVFSRMPQLRRIELWGQPVTDTGLAHLHGNRALVQLRFPDGQFTDVGLSSLRELSSLTVLDLGYCQISDAGLANLAGLTRMRMLSLGCSEITDTGLDHLKSMRDLRGLGLSRANITDAALARIGDWPELESLDLSHTKVSEAGLVHLRCLKHLRRLALAGNAAIGDSAAAGLEAFSGLESLDLSNTKITDAGVVRLARLTQLRELCLSDCDITARSLVVFSGLDKLKRLGVGQTRIAADELARWRAMRPGLDQRDWFYVMDSE